MGLPFLRACHPTLSSPHPGGTQDYRDPDGGIVIAFEDDTSAMCDTRAIIRLAPLVKDIFAQDGFHVKVTKSTITGSDIETIATMLFRHRRDIASAISFSTPGMNSSVKLNSLNTMYHRPIIGFEASLINN